MIGVYISFKHIPVHLDGQCPPHVGGIWMDSANGIILDMKNTYGSVCFALNFMQTYA
jgi:hypothetical protein